jgi:hypothetical protein
MPTVPAADSPASLVSAAALREDPGRMTFLAGAADRIIKVL